MKDATSPDRWRLPVAVTGLAASGFHHASDVEIHGSGFRHLITSRHGSVTAWTAIHTTNHTKRLGGVRFAERGSVEEVAHLAIGMSEKAAAASVPIDGLKCLIECPDGVPDSFSERAALVSAHLRFARRIDADIIFGPDMLAAESVLSLVADEPDLANNVTGLDRKHGGIDIDGNGLTAIGVFEAVSKAYPGTGSPSVAIQGFGAVGAELARLMSADGYRIVAVSNRLGLLYRKTGLDTATCHARWKESGDAWIESASGDGAEPGVAGGSVLTIACDILVPAARTVVLAAADELQTVARENPEVIAVERLLDGGAPRLVAEAANHPLTERAEQLLQDAGTLILPDVLVNCGGMIGCWYEYENRTKLLGDEAAYDCALMACRSRIGEVVQRNTQAVIDGVSAGRNVRDIARAVARADRGRPANI